MPVKSITAWFSASLFFLLFTIMPLPVLAVDSACSYCRVDPAATITAAELEAMIESQSGEDAFVAVQWLAAPLIEEQNWAAAAGVYRQYRSRFPEMSQRFDRIIALLEAPAEGLNRAALGRGINTRGPEFRPVVAADGTTLFFGRNRGPEAGGEDIYYSVMDRYGWQKAKNIGPPLSTDSHEIPLGVSVDGNTILLFGNYPDGLDRGDIFYATRNEKCWSAVLAYPPPVNSDDFDSDAMLTADGRAMLFISDRPGGTGEYHPKDAPFHGSYAGNTDIYVFVPNADGSGQLINLGETINTPFAEYSPFLHPDGKTLYFSSDGHYGLGGLDVFKSERLSETSWTEWSEPVNLGKEINGPHNDWGYQITTAGDLAYYAAAATKLGGAPTDIYQVSLPAQARPGAVVAVSGRVTDPAGKPLQAKIVWNDLDAGQSAGEASSNPQTGDYYIALPLGRRYSYSAEKEGYMGASDHLDFSKLDRYTEYTQDIVLYPADQLADGLVSIRLNNIFFDYDRFNLRADSFPELDRWVGFLRKNSGLKATLEGHTDSIGLEGYNQALSEKRAGAVAEYLVKNGIDRGRISSVGYGETRPSVANDTAFNRQKNRRVEIRFSR